MYRALQPVSRCSVSCNSVSGCNAGLLGGLSAGDINLLSRGHAEASAQLSAPPSPAAAALQGAGPFGGTGLLPGAAAAQQQRSMAAPGAGRPASASLAEAGASRSFGGPQQVRRFDHLPTPVPCWPIVLCSTNVTWSQQSAAATFRGILHSFHTASTCISLKVVVAYARQCLLQSSRHSQSGPFSVASPSVH